jgi:hypothetical protein
MSIDRYRKHIAEMKASLLDKPISFFGVIKYRDFFLFDKGYFFIDKQKVLDTIKDYHELDILTKIWWYITKPMGRYKIMNDIIALHEMESEPLETGIKLYKELSVSKHVRWWNRLANDIRNELDIVISEMKDLKETPKPDISNMLNSRINNMNGRIDDQKKTLKKDDEDFRKEMAELKADFTAILGASRVSQETEHRMRM